MGSEKNMQKTDLGGLVEHYASADVLQEPRYLFMRAKATNTEHWNIGNEWRPVTSTTIEIKKADKNCEETFISDKKSDTEVSKYKISNSSDLNKKCIILFVALSCLLMIFTLIG